MPESNLRGMVDLDRRTCLISSDDFHYFCKALPLHTPSRQKIVKPLTEFLKIEGNKNVRPSH